MRPFTAMKHFRSARGFYYYARQARYAGYGYAALARHGC